MEIDIKPTVDIPALTKCKHVRNCPQMGHFKRCPSLRKYAFKLMDEWLKRQTVVVSVEQVEEIIADYLKNNLSASATATTLEAGEDATASVDLT